MSSDLEQSTRQLMELGLLFSKVWAKGLDGHATAAPAASLIFSNSLDGQCMACHMALNLQETSMTSIEN